MMKKIVAYRNKCVVCEKEIPNGKLCVRKEETLNVICLLCLIELAELT